MLIVRDDNSPVDSVLELARLFNIDLLGSYWAPYFYPNTLEFHTELDQHDAYRIPSTAPDHNALGDILNTSVIPQLQDIIDELDSVSDSPGDPFKLFLTPDETRILFHPDSPGLSCDVEVDYGDLLLLKGILTVVKAQLLLQAPYDLFVEPNDLLVEKYYASALDVNTDALEKHPELLKVLPTSNDPTDGKALLSQARTDLINAADYYLDAVDYIRGENDSGCDPQDDDLLFIDPNDSHVLDVVCENIKKARDSLPSDGSQSYAWETTKTFEIIDSDLNNIGSMTLVLDATTMQGSEGTLIFHDTNDAPSPWRIYRINIGGGPAVKTPTNSENASQITAELTYDVPGQWGGGYFEGVLAPDGNSITDCSFEYWGNQSGDLNNIYAELAETQIVYRQLDLNPVFGDSPRYPNPVHPRELLPEFDRWNCSLPGTVGHGLGYDATLAGITPDMTQFDWQLLFDLQPAGVVYLYEAYPWQKNNHGYVDLWLYENLLLQDPASDTSNPGEDVNNADLDCVYAAYDSSYLYGGITFHDFNGLSNAGYSDCRLYLTYTPQSIESLHTLLLDITMDDGVPLGRLYALNDSYGYPSWESEGSFDVRISDVGLEFKIFWCDIPGYLPGRFICADVTSYDSSWARHDAESNLTHLQFAATTTVSGSITYSGCNGAPIFVQAFTDAHDPDNSIIAAAVIDSPGQYTLEGIGLGWEGYLRASIPLFGFNIFDAQSISAEDIIPVFIWTENLTGLDLSPKKPTMLDDDLWLSDNLDADTRKTNYYCFDALRGGLYCLDLTRTTSDYADMTLLGRDGRTELAHAPYWQNPQHIDWVCAQSGRYFVAVSNGYYEPDGGSYQICMSTDVNCPSVDIADANWPDVKDCTVDVHDLAALCQNWLADCPDFYCCNNADVNHDKKIDFRDLATLAAYWKQSGTIP